MVLIYDLFGVFFIFGISVKTKDAVGNRVYRAFGLYSEFEKGFCFYTRLLLFYLLFLYIIYVMSASIVHSNQGSNHTRGRQIPPNSINMIMTRSSGIIKKVKCRCKTLKSQGKRAGGIMLSCFQDRLLLFVPE